jgi:hypothetical protein
MGTSRAAHHDLVDQLVPPPWSQGRRFGVAAVLAVIALAVGVLWWVGVLGPNIAPVGEYAVRALDGSVTETPGGSRAGTVEIQLQLFNRGQLPLRDLSIDGGPFGAAELDMPSGPVDIGPRHEEQVTVHLAIDDCSLFLAPPQPMLSYYASTAGADGKELRIVDAEAVAATPTWPDAREPDVASWWYELARVVCDAESVPAP